MRVRGDFASSLLAYAENAAGDRVYLDKAAQLLTPAAPAELGHRFGAPSDAEITALLSEACLLALDALEQEAASCG